MMSKPVPVPTTDSAEYWHGCNREELLYQRCGSCSRAQFYPRRMCASCQSEDVSWARSQRRGAIHSFTVVHRPANPSFRDDVPFVIALVDMDEGFRMMLNIVGEKRLSSAIGSRVRIVFEARSPEQKIPQAMLETSP